MRFLDLPRLERHRLDESADARRFEPALRKFRGDILGRARVPGAAGVAALQRIVRQKLDVLPPAVAVRDSEHSGRDDDCGGDQDARLHSCVT